jgi:hypothetical protein
MADLGLNVKRLRSQSFCTESIPLSELVSSDWIPRVLVFLGA